MGQDLPSTIKTTLTKPRLADIFIKARVARVAARIIKGKTKKQSLSQPDVMNAMKWLPNDPDFQRFMPYFKNSSYPVLSGQFAQLVTKY